MKLYICKPISSVVLLYASYDIILSNNYKYKSQFFIKIIISREFCNVYIINQTNKNT